MYVVTIRDPNSKEPGIAFPALVESLELLTEAIEEAIQLSISIETEPQPPDENPQ